MLMNAKETASYLKLSYNAFMRMKQTQPDRIPPFLLLSPRCPRWVKEEVDEWARRRMVATQERRGIMTRSDVGQDATESNP